MIDLKLFLLIGLLIALIFVFASPPSLKMRAQKEGFTIDEKLIFDNVYVVNLERSQGRWNQTVDRLKKININNVKKWVATDATKIDDEYKQNKITITKGEYACYMSHKRLWKHIYDLNIPYALILEDDIILDPSTTKQTILNDINFTIEQNKDFDILFLGYCDGPIFKTPLTQTGRVFCMHAYLVSRKGIEKILSVNHTFSKPVDHFFYYWNGICYVSHDTKTSDDKNIFGNGIFFQDRSISRDIKSYI